jgi:ABC-2 type transport system ATP-binding protein
MNGDTSVPTVVLQGALSRADRRTNWPSLDFTLGPGVHALVGRPEDGTISVAKLVGGIETAVVGRVIVAGRDPGRDPSLRAHIGVTLDPPRVPPVGRVRDYLEGVSAVRGTPCDWGRALADFGLSHWSERKLSKLTRSEGRTLELVVAATTPEPFAIALTEPGADVAPFERRALRDALSRAAQNGACVMIATASTADAVELATTIQVLERGRITRWVPVDESGALVPGRGVALRVEVDLARLLVASLADDPAVTGLDWSPDGHHSVVSIRGDDLDQLALAVARAAVASGVNIRAITPAAPGLDEIRAASSGLALAAYHAAYQAYYGVRPGPAAPSSAPPPGSMPPTSVPPAAPPPPRREQP